MSSYSKRISLSLAVLFSLLGNIGWSQSISESIVCPKKLERKASYGDCGAKVKYTEPFAAVSVEELSSIQNNYDSGSYFETGENTVYYKAADRENNTYFCIFKVNIKDEEKPEFTQFPQDIYVTAAGTEGVPVSWKEPEAVDNCKDAELISSHENGMLFPVGETVVTYWAYDKSGNHVMKSFTVRVISADNEELVSMRK